MGLRNARVCPPPTGKKRRPVRESSVQPVQLGKCQTVGAYVGNNMQGTSTSPMWGSQTLCLLVNITLSNYGWNSPKPSEIVVINQLNVILGAPLFML